MCQCRGYLSGVAENCVSLRYNACQWAIGRRNFVARVEVSLDSSAFEDETTTLSPIILGHCVISQKN